MSKDSGIMPRTTFSSADGSSEDEIRAKREAVRAGIADADAGRLIPFGEIKAWIRSWGSKNELPRPKPPITPRS